MKKIIFAACVLSFGGCVNLNEAMFPPFNKGKFDFGGNLSVTYEVNHQYHLDRKAGICTISLKFQNNSATEKKPYLKLYLLSGGATLSEKSVFFPTAFAGGYSFATETFGLDSRKDCENLTSNMKAKLM